jgi:predicted TIM-barrel fold metal-dependent hydrolase
MNRQIYDGPVVDAHHHFWDPVANPHPWLRPEVKIPFRYGDYSSIKRRYLPAEYFTDAAGQNVVQTVHVEAEWEPTDPVGETRFIHALARQHGVPGAMVAQAWLDHDDAHHVLAQQAAFPLVRSVRHKPGGPPRPEAVGSGTTLMSDEAWRRGYSALARHRLHFDLQTPWWNLPEAGCLARDFPDTVIILNHTGLPSDRSETGLAAWRDAMAAFAKQPNVAVKISGIGVAGQAWTAEANGWIVRQTIEIFGDDRTMFASNFPVDGLCASFATIFNGFREIVADLPVSAQERLFYANARNYYRMALP